MWYLKMRSETAIEKIFQEIKKKTMKLSCLSAVKRLVNGVGSYGPRPEPEAPYVDAVAVLDRSGSMYALLPGAKAGVRFWLEKQKGTKNAHVEVITFDDRVEKPYSGLSSMMMDGDMVRILSALEARGWTRLYDTAVEAIYRQMKRLKKWRSRFPKARMLRCLDMSPVAVLFVLTDGQDNRSTVADSAALTRALSHTKRKWNTLTIFAAANQDAMESGRSYGFNAQTILQMDAAPAAVSAVFRSATAAQARAVSGVPARMTQLERESSAPSQYHHGSTAPAILGSGTPPTVARPGPPPPRRRPRPPFGGHNAIVGAPCGGGGRGCSAGGPLAALMAPPPPRFPRARHWHPAAFAPPAPLPVPLQRTQAGVLSPSSSSPPSSAANTQSNS